MKKLFLVFTLCFLCFSFKTFSQTDSVTVGEDTIFFDASSENLFFETDTGEVPSVVKAKKGKNPKTATWMSAVLPGLGQAYNRKYWKIPIVYAGLGTTSYLIYHFNKDVIRYRTENRLRSDARVDLMGVELRGTPDPDLAYMKDANIAAEENKSRRNVEICIVALSLCYLLNILDATVDAHMSNFSISDDLSFQILPFSNAPNYYAFSNVQTNLGFTFILNF